MALNITFKTSAEVSSPFITLADIAVFDQQSPLSKSLASIRIGNAPPAGDSITLDTVMVKNTLSRELTQGQSVQWNGPASLLLRRKGVSIGPQEVESAIRDHIESQKENLPLAEYTFIPNELPLPFVIPTGQLEIEVLPSKPGIIGSNRFSLIFKVDNKILKNISVRGKLKAIGDVVVLTRNVKRGAILQPDMIQIEKNDLSSLRDPCTDLREVLGKKVLKSMRSGSILDISNIDFPPVIQKGQLVKILINHNGLKLTATGIATTNGKQDQVIRVQNTGSQKMVFCRVSAPGIVEVKI